MGAGRYRNLASDNNTLDWRGDLYGTQVGVDGRTRGQWLRGLVVDWSDGRFEWNGTDPTGGPFRTGYYDVELAGAYPYAGWASVDGAWRLWGVGGYAWGQVGVTEADADRSTQRSDVAALMGALGVSRDLRLVDGVLPSGVTQLRMKGNASTIWFDLAGNAGKGRLLEPLSVSAHRLRLALEASHEHILQGGGRVVSSLGVGTRGDFGDGNTVAALETSAGLLYFRPELGLTLGGNGHLLALSDDGSEEWGIDVVLSYDAGKPRRGLMIDMSSGYGAPSQGPGGLWDQDATALPISTPSMPEPRLAVEVGYGLPVADGRGSWAPSGAYAMTSRDDRSFRVGGRWEFNSGLRTVVDPRRRASPG